MAHAIREAHRNEQQTRLDRQATESNILHLKSELR